MDILILLYKCSQAHLPHVEAKTFRTHYNKNIVQLTNTAGVVTAVATVQSGEEDVDTGCRSDVRTVGWLATAGGGGCCLGKEEATTNT